MTDTVKLVHDPHPSREGILKVETVYMISALLKERP